MRGLDVDVDVVACLEVGKEGRGDADEAFPAALERFFVQDAEG